MKLNTIQRKKFRVTGKLKKVSSPDRLRLSISRSANNISAQIIDDTKNITVVSCSSVEKDIRAMDKTNKTEISKIVAEKLAKKAGKPKWEVEEVDHTNIKKKIAQTFETDLRKAFKEIDKKKRSAAISEIETPT